ncbi:MAG TPA: hypothetical protein VGD59_02065 [Acidisarcina sp.]
MRLAVAITATVQGLENLTAPRAGEFSPLITGPLEIALGAALLFGLLTPLAGLAAALASVAAIVPSFFAPNFDVQPRTVTAIDLAVMSFALVALGPGAYSLDAFLFGRREILIPEASQAPRD